MRPFIAVVDGAGSPVQMPGTPRRAADFHSFVLHDIILEASICRFPGADAMVQLGSSMVVHIPRGTSAPSQPPRPSLRSRRYNFGGVDCAHCPVHMRTVCTCGRCACVLSRRSHLHPPAAPADFHVFVLHDIIFDASQCALIGGPADSHCSFYWI